MSGFATWGQAVQRIPAGETVFGTPINVLEAPFLHGVTIVEAPLLRPYTAIALTSSRSLHPQQAESLLEPARQPRRHGRGRLDRRAGDRGRERVAPRLGRGYHGLLGELSIVPSGRSLLRRRLITTGMKNAPARRISTPREQLHALAVPRHAPLSQPAGPPARHDSGPGRPRPQQSGNLPRLGPAGPALRALPQGPQRRRPAGARR